MNKHQEKEDLQQKIYQLLINSNMPKIPARFLAYKLVEKQIVSIKNIEKKGERKFIIRSDKSYLVNLPLVDVMDFQIEEL